MRGPKYSLVERERRFLIDATKMSPLDPATARLIEAEVSVADDIALAAVEVPDWCGREVTDDRAFAGGTLAIRGPALDRTRRFGQDEGEAA